jgi:hypothetical protein
MTRSRIIDRSPHQSAAICPRPNSMAAARLASTWNARNGIAFEFPFTRKAQTMKSDHQVTEDHPPEIQLHAGMIVTAFISVFILALVVWTVA